MAKAWLSDEELSKWNDELFELNTRLSNIPGKDGNLHTLAMNEYIKTFLSCYTAKYSEKLAKLTTWLIALTVVLGILTLVNIVLLLS